MNGIVRVESITKIYSLGDVKVEALRKVSFSVEAGEFLSIMGASGSGKSTMMNILGCLDTPTGGQYFLEGHNVSRLSGDELADIRKHKIGFVFQGFNLLPRMTALENVKLPMLYNGVHPSMRDRKAMDALEMVGLGDRANHQPQQLSGGQQQRVAIARALVNDAPIILADEPTGNLDSRTSKDIMDLFTDLNREYGRTIIQVTHEAEMASYGKRVITFRDGMVLKDERTERP
ncbi:MAG: ABC transporter ATP-binding protein [Thermovirgaceae bacterium]|nr:ABC transporter ATP-binding protein [Synergistales bacterium]MDI9393400.1 ABC transporter ATP-binding protein [Synergistota bacterium]NLV64407.1 ABC transporter ATP-binding protein [Synergistaceae bacterium]HRW87620.1 ABC transporter ATP-binding protein [Thermovirgaceae bacterium]MDD3133446.1 ABC transporter ATP-binding protein [Synergistales bacterium]